MTGLRVLSVVHELEAGSGVFGDVASARGDEVVEWIPAESPPPEPDRFDAALVFGGATHADQELDCDWLRGEKELLRALLAHSTPALGVCLGAQLLAEAAGGHVKRAATPEIGWTPVLLSPQASDDPLLATLPTRFTSFQWHSYAIRAPRDAVTLAYSDACLQAFRLRARPWWGIQFHAEATEETIAGWIENYRSDPDAASADLNWPAMRAETRREIDRWNELGAGICDRFLEIAGGPRA